MGTPAPLPLRIRPMEPQDVPPVAEICRLSFPRPWSRENIAVELSRPTTHAWVAEITTPHPRVVGLVFLWAADAPGYIPLIAVHPDFRQRGIGKRLMETVIAAARRLGLHGLTLEVRVSNRAAQALYRALGFEVIAHCPRYYPDNGEDGLRMHLTLRPAGGAP